MSRKHDPEFTKLIEEHVLFNKETGELTLNNLYGNLCMNISHKGNIVVVPYSHLIWFKTYGKWPTEGMHIDHINNNPLDNRPINLAEISEAENHEKRRGRMVYRSYGSGKYGYGINIHHDKRDNRYYIVRHLSRGHGNGDLKTIRKGLGGFDTLEEAKGKVACFIKEIKMRGLDYMPESVGTNRGKTSKRLTEQTEYILELRKSGLTYKEIANKTGFSDSSIYNTVKSRRAA